MDAELWFREWALMYDGFPDDYFVVDIETTGNNVERDLIIQLGWCRVANRQVVDNSGTVLNWTNSPYVDASWVKKRMQETAKQMNDPDSMHKHYPWTFEDLKDGYSPIEALGVLLDKLESVRRRYELVIAHNGISFDLPVLSSHFKRFLRKDHNIQDNEYWDTGALEKACQIDELLCQGEMPGAFAYRVLNRNNDGQIKWSLFNHAVPKYELDKKYNIELGLAHTAPFDAYVTHLLLEQYRSLAEKGFERCQKQ